MHITLIVLIPHQLFLYDMFYWSSFFINISHKHITQRFNVITQVYTWNTSDTTMKALYSCSACYHQDLDQLYGAIWSGHVYCILHSSSSVLFWFHCQLKRF